MHRPTSPIASIAAAALVCACGGAGASGHDAAGADAASPDAVADAATCPPPVPTEPGLVATDIGPLRGVAAGDTWAFLGVPYAAPPLGELRWQPPRPTPCEPAIRDANAFPPSCPQYYGEMGSDQREYRGEEDCLYLNLWTPQAVGELRPVLVFLHGGGNVQGATSNQSLGAYLFDGELLSARGGVVVVTVQYRLGALGFLALPELSAQSATGGSGNYGLLDQIAALDWVQRNAPHFGGDPDRVMVFGESAGAVDTCALLASPLAAGRFQRALMQSGGCVAGALAEREDQGAAFAAEVGCDGAEDVIACLRGTPAEALAAATPAPFTGGIASSAFGPTVDGHVLPDHPFARIAAGAHNRVPLVIGSNADETAVTILPGTVTPASWQSYLTLLFAEPARSQALALYPPGETDSEARWSKIGATSDAQFICPVRTIAGAVADQQDEPVWRYSFTHRAAGAAGAVNGSFHGLELFYVFQNLERTTYAPSMTDGDRAVVGAMLRYWTRFAATGDPNGGDDPAWPAYPAAGDGYLEIDGTPEAGDGVRTPYCDFWDDVTAGE